MFGLNLKNRSIRPIGLDIGHDYIRMTQLVIRDEKISVHAAEEARVEIDKKEDEQAWKSIVIATIKRLFVKGNFSGNNTISCLPSGDLKITSLRLTQAESEKTEQIIKREVAQRFKLNPENDAMDYIVAGNVRQGDEIKKELVLFACSNEKIKNHIEILEEAGLKPVSLDIMPCALFRSFERSFRRQEDMENAVVFVDIGSLYTTIVFGRGQEICFVKQLKIGGDNFNSEVASKLGITNKEAEVLRKELQNEDRVSKEDEQKIDASTRQRMIDAISKVAEELAKEISLCLRYYSVTFRGKRIERAIFTGGGSYENILLNIMKRQLAVGVEIAQPFRGFDFQNEKVNIGINEGNGLLCEWAVAIGLSLKGMDAIRRNRREVYSRT
ncbi:MAG: pilus assembly protein PilM [Sedimentisphaerales bacterium]|nr:pilus assembly protein PilM [Sedimentisphaerales bacterium]